jgi:hypothetical protein
MLEIKPIQAKDEQEEICRLCGVGFDPGCLAYGAWENGGLVGMAQFRIIGERGVIYDLSNASGVDDFEALVIMGKAALDFIRRCGIEEKNIDIKLNDEKLIQAVIDRPCDKNKR